MTQLRKISISLATVLMASACAASHEETIKEDSCNANSYQALIGTNIAAITLPEDLYHRIIAPDTIVTKDYRLDRINFYTDENGIITQISCG